MEPILYLAYGSNLNLEDMARRCPQAQVAGRARLEGWRLAVRGGGSGFYLTLEACPGSSVPVGVWAVEPEGLQALDHYEGYPRLYTREFWPTAYQDQTGREHQGRALIYLMRPHFPAGRPTQTYLEACRAGYRSFGFDPAPLEAALDRLSERPEPWNHQGIAAP